uniref:DUF148 domain-containing protein n=1 Tax=Caenorhabditis tropicalis TaxID=1561998 RepID=A0A1I7UPK7_9PELO
MRASLLWVMLCILCLASAKLARDPRRLQQMVVTHELFGSIEELAERRGLKLGKRKFFTQTSEKFQDTSSPISTSEFQSSAQPLQTSSTTPLADLQNHSKTHVEKETTISLNESSSILLNNPIDISTTDSSQKQTSHSSQQSTASVRFKRALTFSTYDHY